MNFIKTQDAELAATLRVLGYKELKKTGSFFVFANNGKATFSDNDRKRMIFTNKMEV